MRILVFGNINAGKSVVVSELLRRYPVTPVLSIDDYRRRYGDGTHEGDTLAMDRFVGDATATFDGIIECTGLGPLGYKLHEALPVKEVLLLHVTVPLEECLSRIDRKDFAATPYPPFSESLPDTIRRCHAEFERGDLQALWDDVALWTFPVDGTTSDLRNEIDRLPLRQLSALASVVYALRKSRRIDALVWYGSGARGELTPESDIDLFAVTAVSANELSNLLADTIPDIVFHDHIGTKVTLRFADHTLVEINCSRNMSGIDAFYVEARIQNHRRAVLIGDGDVREHLETIASRDVDRTPLADFLLSECVYFVLSLPSIASRGDQYKYYFHNNIVIHNVIRLKALASEDDFLNFLPPNALRFLEPEEVEVLSYRLGDDMVIHARGLRSYMQRLIKTLGLPDIDRARYVSYLERLDAESENTINGTR